MFLQLYPGRHRLNAVFLETHAMCNPFMREKISVMKIIDWNAWTILLSDFFGVTFKINITLFVSLIFCDFLNQQVPMAVNPMNFAAQIEGVFKRLGDVMEMMIVWIIRTREIVPQILQVKRRYP